MNLSLEKICSQVQRNCHIADAHHGGDYGMCTYLLKMREFFRWEQGLGFQSPIPTESLGNWLMEREQLWEQVADSEFSSVEVAGERFDPFDNEGINRALNPLGLVYSAGLVDGARANFYLAELLQHEYEDGFPLYVSGREYARCLTAPPAMSSEQGVFLRQEALRRYLWEKYESWGWNRPDNALGRAYACYDFPADADTALEQMMVVETAAAREHELGEYQATQILGEGWNRMLLDLTLTPAELMARAVKDHIADCSRTLPMLLRQVQPASLHFYIGNLSGMRKHLFPQLLETYSVWQERGDLSPMQELVETANDFWLSLAQEMLDLHHELGNQAAHAIKSLVERRCGLETNA
ncbi:Sfum_1244 family protein [Thiolapillus sp.]